MRLRDFLSLWFIWIILALLGFACVNEIFKIIVLDENPAINSLMSDIVVFLASTMIAVGGVTITGFIFFIESIRRLVDTNQTFADTVDDMRRRLLRAVIYTFTICILYAIVCGVCMVFVFDSVGGDHARSVTAYTLIIAYIILLADNIILDYRIMGYKKYLSEVALQNKSDIRSDEKRTLRYIRVRPDEMLTLPEKARDLSDDALAFTNDNLNKRSFACVVGDAPYMLPLEIEISLTDRIKMLSRGKDNKKKSAPPKVIGYCEIDDSFDIRDVMKVYDDTERILKRIANIDNESFMSDDYKKLESALESKSVVDSNKGLSDDIVEGYHLLKKFHDSLVIAENPVLEDTMISTEDLHFMMPYLSALRFELVRKLSGKDLSGINLRGYDFTDAVMKNTILADGAYIDAIFSAANLDCADISNCDLSMSDFTSVSAKSTVFNGSKMVRSDLDGSCISGSSFIGTTFRHASMVSTTATGCVMKNAEVLTTNIQGSDFSGSDLRYVNCVGTTAENVRFANAIFDGSRISDGTFRVCDFTGTNFGSSAINNMYFQDMTLNATRFDKADVMECIFVGCSFYDAYCHAVNFTGSVLMGVNFSESRLSDCDFNKTVIGPYRAGADDGKLNEPDFTHANMVRNTYTDSKIVKAKFNYASLKGSRFSNTYFEECDFSNCDLDGVMFLDCTFKGCNGVPEDILNSNGCEII